MVKRNPYFERLSPRYLFPEINARKRAFLAQNPSASLISLGVGDTTEPLSPIIAEALSNQALSLSTRSGYLGYGHEQGQEQLREKIAEAFYGKLKISADEIFVSDGAKCDIGRLQQLFGSAVSIAVQDPSYPVYVDGSLIKGVEKIVYMPCSPVNDFFPDLSDVPRTDLIYFCSPNNPTGAAATKAQLEKLVNYARKNKSIILYDAAYSPFIRDPSLPRSIYEIEGAHEVAIEIHSFSKLAGFTGVRLGWTVVPSSLIFDDGHKVKDDWHRLTSTIFNAASNISQSGGLAVLSTDGLSSVQATADFYMENASLLKQALSAKGLKVFGGDHAPYLWVSFEQRRSWDVFQEILEKAHLICTPGVGFGSGGESFVRFTAFTSRFLLLEGISRIEKFL